MGKKEILSEIIDWIKTIFLSLLLAFFILQFIRPTLVNGQSMDSTLKDGDFIIINRNSYMFSSPSRGDIIVFRSDFDEEVKSSIFKKILTGEYNDKKNLVKRVIGVGGDKIKIHNKRVYVNNKLIDEKYLNKENINNTEGEMDIVVPKGKVFVLGDNREVSLDSRYESVGFIKVSDIVGKPFIRLFPFNKIKLI